MGSAARAACSASSGPPRGVLRSRARSPRLAAEPQFARPSRRRARPRSTASGCRRSPGSGRRRRRVARSPRRRPGRPRRSAASTRPRRRRRAAARKLPGDRAAGRCPPREASTGQHVRQLRRRRLRSRRGRPPEARARPGPGGPRARASTPARRARGCARRCRPAMPPLRDLRTRARSRPPARRRGPGSARGTWPTRRSIGVESCIAVCTPTAAWVAPGPRVTMQIPGRPVSFPYASAAFAAPCSCRQVTSRIGESYRASSSGRKLSPGRQKARSAPFSSSWSARMRPPFLTAVAAPRAGPSHAGASAAPRRRRRDTGSSACLPIRAAGATLGQTQCPRCPTRRQHRVVGALEPGLARRGTCACRPRPRSSARRRGDDECRGPDGRAGRRRSLRGKSTRSQRMTQSASGSRSSSAARAAPSSSPPSFQTRPAPSTRAAPNEAAPRSRS